MTIPATGGGGSPTSTPTINTPQDWANALLTFMGLPTSQSNVQFLVSWAAMEGGNWNNTATYNPLNTTLQLPGSSVMSGGNTAGVQAYQSWDQGLQAISQTLQGYPGIMAALQSGNATQADQSGQLSGDFSKWSGGGYTSVPINTSYANQQPTQGMTGGGTVGTPQAPAQANQPPPQSLSMNDIPAVQAYIKQNFGTDSWLLDIPDVASVLEQAVVNGDSTAQIQAAIQQTNWWKTTSQAVKNYEQNSANNPADYSFTTPGSTAAQTLAQVQQTAAQAGVQLDAQTAQTIATDSLKFGWNSQQLQQAIGSRVQYSGSGGNAQTIVQQLKQMANQYYMNLTPQALQSWAQNLAAGTQTMQQFQAQMSQQAALKWTGYSQQIQAGNTMVQLTDSLRNEAAKTMEVDPSTIDFANNPTYQKILDYVPPNSPNGVHRVMTLSEMDQYLKSQPQWGYTQAARDQAAQLEATITQTWGRIAS